MHPWQPESDPEAFLSDEDWELEKIVSEDYDALGQRSYEVGGTLSLFIQAEHSFTAVLQIAWTDWQREDGTNTTWQYGDLSGAAVAVDLWQKTTATRRKQKAQMSLGTDLQGPDIPFHMHRTFEIAEAHREKREKSRGSLSQYSGWDNVPSLSRDAVFVTTSTIASRVSSRSQSSHGSLSSQEPRQITRRKRPAVPFIESSPEPPDSRPSSTKPASHSSQSSRLALQTAWQGACRQAAAASIRICNEVDGEQVPPVIANFRYIETGYDLGTFTFPDDGFLLGCSCETVCEDAKTCDCQAALPHPDDGVIEAKTHAYDANHCICGKSCHNRVAQFSRDVPIEIFRTIDRGWGARAPKDLSKGKFLGLYSGSREEAHNITPERRSYTFDLDTLEDTDQFDEDSKYSVDAYAQVDLSVDEPPLFGICHESACNSKTGTHNRLRPEGCKRYQREKAEKARVKRLQVRCTDL
ncbi:hypothetical protein PHLCEN_2v964 [Hermanssonia centrifuga]|uniref:Pre-SET domain-containing protein n=1 Tax=Hermanssonia centrifuga TaxID=98765 RepID=A0A2R6S4L5_9APHY|nr:hypothetical protein PHLCEN_2v964 [Hermanssonia centrifuga]